MEETKVKNFKDLKIWKKSIEIVEEVYRATQKYPKEETYGIVSQLRRSAVSVPSNIAEGFMRYHKKEFKQFLFITLSSSAEMETQLIISRNLKYLKENDCSKLLDNISSLNKMTMSLIKKL